MSFLQTAAQLRNFVAENPQAFTADMTPDQVWAKLHEVNKGLVNRYESEIRAENIPFADRELASVEITKQPKLVAGNAAEIARAAAEDKAYQEKLNQIGEQGKAEEQIQRQVADRLQSAFSSRIGALYDQARESGVQDINRQYAPQLSQQLAQNAALGIKGGVATYGLNRIKDRQNDAISSYLGNAASNRANAEGNLAQTLEQMVQNRALNKQNLGLSQLSLSQQMNQFNQNMGLNKQRMADEAARYQDEQRWKQWQRKQMEEANEMSTFDKVNMGMNTTRNFTNLTGWEPLKNTSEGFKNFGSGIGGVGGGMVGR